MSVSARRWGTEPAILIGVLAVAPFVEGVYGLQALTGYLALAILALSLDWVWGYGGILSFAQGALFGIGAYAVAVILERVSGTSGLLLGLGAAVAVASVLAYLLARVLFSERTQGLFFVAVGTLTFAGVLEQVVLGTPDLTGGHNGLIVASVVLPSGVVGAYYLMLAVFAAVLVALAVLVRSDFGRQLVGLREAEERLRFLGAPTARIQTLAFVIGAGVAALGGAMYASYSQIASPDVMGFAFATQAVIWVAVGGRGSLIGAALGAIVLNMVSAQLAESFLFYWQVILGAILILVVRFAPQGLYPLLRGLLPRRRQPPVVVRERLAQPSPDGDHQGPVNLLTVEDLRRSYGSLAVLQGVDMKVDRGELRCLIGPNGAGKSTFIDVVSGRQRASSGSVLLRARSIAAATADRIARSGLLRTFQAASAFDRLTVGENLVLATQAGRLGSLWRRTTKIELSPPAFRLLGESGLDEMLDRPVGDIGHGARKWLELTMVLASEPDLLLLDEPTAGLTKAERMAIGRLLQAECERGLAVVVVEHDFEFVRQIADRVTVLHNGRVLALGSVDEVGADEAVREVYLGQRA